MLVTMEELGNLGDFLGGLAVIITLVYLTLQIRTQTSEVRLTATRELSASFVSILQSLAHDGELSDIYHRGIRDYDSLKDLERIRFNMFLHSLFRIYEQSYLHTTHVGVDDTYYHSLELTRQDVLGFPGVHRWWQRSGHLFEPAFVKHVMKVINSQTEQKKSAL